MEIVRTDNGNKGQFSANIDGKEIGLMTYTGAGPGKVIIDHTEVDESLKGQGIGYKLVEAAVLYARENQIKIMPLCPFASAVFRKRSEYQDVLF